LKNNSPQLDFAMSLGNSKRYLTIERA